MERILFRFEVCANGVESSYSCPGWRRGPCGTVRGNTRRWHNAVVWRDHGGTSGADDDTPARHHPSARWRLPLHTIGTGAHGGRHRGGAPTGVNGVVIGCLHEDGTIDMEANRRLVEKSKGNVPDLPSGLRPLLQSFRGFGATDRLRLRPHPHLWPATKGHRRCSPTAKAPPASRWAHHPLGGLWRERAEHTQPLRTDGYQGISLLCPRADEKQNGIQQSRGLHGRPQRRRRHLALHDGGAGTRHYRPTNRREIARRDT